MLVKGETLKSLVIEKKYMALFATSICKQLLLFLKTHLSYN